MRNFRFRRRPSFGRRVRMARPIVRAVTGTTLAKRIQLDAFSITDPTSANYDTTVSIGLLVCQETMDEEVESNGTTIAQVPLYSRLRKMRMALVCQAAEATIIRWRIVKRPDGENLSTDLTNTGFHVSDDTPTEREMRKFTMAKGQVLVSGDSLAAPMRVFISRAALNRNATFREGDRIDLQIAKTNTGTAATISGFGTAWVRANA